MQQATAWGLGSVAWLAGLVVLAAGDQPRPLALGSQRQLFVDRHLIDRLDGLTLALHKPRPANVILKSERPWEGNHNFATGVFHHDGRYRLYYRADDGGTFGGKQVACVAFSDDGVHWKRPNVGLVEVNGTKDNNVVACEDEKGRLKPASGNYDFWLDTRPGVPAAERFKWVTYSTNGGPHNPGPTSGKDAVHRATFWVSADGLRFRKMDPQPNFASTLKNSFDSFNVYFWSDTERQYVCYFRCYDSRRTVARTTSKDLMTWTEPVVMSYGRTPREHLYTNQTEPYFRAPHLYVALPARFMEGRKGALTEEQYQRLAQADFYKQRAKFFNSSPTDGAFMTTRPGATAYDRTFMESFIRPGLGYENWVNRGNYPLRGVFQTGPAEMSLYVNRHYTLDSWHIERLTLRLDGFASLHAPFEGGEMLTRPFTFEGDKLTLNYATSVAGNVQVEIQDADGRALPGFTLKEADPVFGDELERAVTWRGKSDVRSLAGRPIRLRVRMRDADLYSFRFE